MVVKLIGTAGLKLIAWKYWLSPRPFRRAMVFLLSSILRLLKLRAKVIRENLNYAFPDDPRRREALFEESYRHLAELILEIMMLFGPIRRYAAKECALIGVEHWKRANLDNKGVILLISHVGNWEVSGAVGVLKGDMNLMCATKHLKPEWFHQAVEEARARCGVSCAYEPRTLKDILGHLKRQGTVAIVMDQYVGAPIGIRVPFFGIPVGTSSVVAMLAKRTGAPVLPVVAHRTENGGYLVEIQEAASWTKDGDAARELALNTANYAKIVEGHIYAYPGQWLWSHRRFKGDLSPLRNEEWSSGRARS